jgi:hypothetical protein
MRRAWMEFRLGARLAVTGGADARLRVVLTAIGATLGVTLLLVAASVPNVVSEHNVRNAAVEVQAGEGATRLLGVWDFVSYRGQSITGLALQPVGHRPPLPPGVAQLPGPGEMVVSPALGDLLRSPAGAELKRWLDARVVGTIGERGLTGPSDLRLYRGASDLRAYGSMSITRFGGVSSSQYHGALVTLLVILMSIALLLPVGVFVATASRFGSDQRNVRLAAIRLVGADRAGTARIAAAEALVGTMLGVVLGCLLFLAIRPLISHVDIAGISVFSSDVRPAGWLVMLIVLLVPAAAVAFALLATRRAAIEPLGVSRRGSEPRRRLAWRLVMPLLGFLLLAPLIGANNRLASTIGQIEASAGVLLVLVGVSALLPWFVEAAARRADRGPLPWLLAVRRIRADHGTSGRVVSAIALTVAGAIALQTVFNAADAETNNNVPASPTGHALYAFGMLVRAPGAAADVERQLRSTGGVEDAIALANDNQNHRYPISVGSCQTLTLIVNARHCTDGSLYIVRAETGLRPGASMRLGGRAVRVPDAAREVTLRSTVQTPTALASSIPLGVLLLTPGAAANLGIHADLVDASVAIDPHLPGASDNVHTTVARIDPLANVQSNTPTPVNHVLKQLQNVLFAGATVVLIVIGGSLLVAIAEQLRERRRVLAVLSAFGTRPSTIAWSVLWQNALPVAVGLALAVVMGVGLGDVLMHIIGLQASFDWGAIALLTAAAALVVAVVTGATLPLVWRQMRPEALRVE